MSNEKRRHHSEVSHDEAVDRARDAGCGARPGGGFAACGGSDDTTSAEETTAAETSAEETSGGEEEVEGSGTAIESNPDNAKVSLTIGSKNFPEQEILGEIYAQALTAAGYQVKSDLSLGSETVALKAVESGAISGYPEYASTALTSFFGFEPEEVPSNPNAAWKKANAEFQKKRARSLRTDPVCERQRGRDC